jgi:hypothetical protein
MMSARRLKGTATSVDPVRFGLVWVGWAWFGLVWVGKLTNFFAVFPQRKHRPEAFLACGPQKLLLPLILGKLKVAPAVVPRNILHHGYVLLDAVLGAGELEEEGRKLLPHAGRGRPAHVDHLHLDLIHDFHGGHGDARLHHLGGGGGGIPDGRKRYHGHRVVFGDDGKLESGCASVKIKWPRSQRVGDKTHPRSPGPGFLLTRQKCR